MRTNYREVARLKRKEVSNRRISEIMNVSRNTINRIVHIVIEKKLGWGEIEQFSDHELLSVVESTESNTQTNYVIPDYARLSKELARPGVTMQLLWEEYQDQCRSIKPLATKQLSLKNISMSF